MKTPLQRLACLFIAVATTLLSSAATVTLSFSGTTTEGRYCLLDSVRIENLSLNTTQVLDCEQDTSCTLEVSNAVPTGIDNVYASHEHGGLISDCYSTIYGETSFTLNPSSDGITHLRVIDMAGRMVMEHVEYLCAGSHQFELQLSVPQLYILHVATEQERAAVKVLNLSHTGACNLFRVASIPSMAPRRVMSEETPDLIRYTGYTNQKGQAVASEPVTQYQGSDEHVVLNFAPVAKSQEGLYVAMTGFNSQLYQYPFDILTTSNLYQHQQFVNNLQMASGTILYHAVYTALENIVQAPVPEKIENVSLVTFTDGLDIGSWRMNRDYPSEALYLAAVNRQIRRTCIDGVMLDAYAIGVKGSDVTDVTRFENDLHQLASDSTNVYSVTNMDEVNMRFREIAAKIYNTKVDYSLTVKLPAPDPGSVIRFTFDNVYDAANSIYYIEGTYEYDFDNGVGVLKDVTYSGIKCSNGETWISVPSGIFDLFTINNLTNSLGERVSTSSMQQWVYIPSTQSWQVNSEFNPLDNSTTTENHTSAIVMLVLDCSSSLSGDFSRMQSAANTFLNILAGKGDITTPSVSKATFTLGDLQTTMQASITNTGNLSITDKGFAVSENPNMDDAQLYSVGAGTEDFMFVLPDLVLGKKYYCRPYADNSWGRAFGAISSFTAIEYVAPTLITDDAYDITINSAKCRGAISFDGYAAIIERGFCWSTTPNPTIDDNYVTVGSSNSSFYGTIEGLNDGATYYIRAYAKNSKHIGYGNEKTFTTIAIVPPTVVTGDITDITINSAICTGYVISDGNSVIVERGLCWSTNPNPTIDDNVLVSNYYGIDEELLNLEDGTTYYVRAYAKNSKCVGYGEEKSFTTIAIVAPTVETGDISEITINSATCRGEVTSDGNSPVLERGLCWGTTPNPTIDDNHIVAGSGTGSFNGLISDLDDATTYYIRAYAKNNKEVGYGEEKSFATIAIVEPVVSLSSADVISMDSALCIGNISFDGNSPIVERGFCWNTSPNPTIDDNSTIIKSDDDIFEGNITDLDVGTKYYVRAYVKNSKHIGYSSNTLKVYISYISYESNTDLRAKNSGLNANAFDVSIAKHEFNDGKGLIVFNGCLITIGSGAFEGCSGLKEIAIPNNVTSIGSSAFYGCSGLKEITIPDSVTSIGNYAFSGCSGLTSIIIPNSVTSIGSGAFEDCSSLTSVAINNSVENVGSYAFSGCNSLIEITIPDNITSIATGAFFNCVNMTSAIIGNRVTSIDSKAFYGCSGLSSITIGNAVTNFGNYAFYGCTSLSNVIWNAKNCPDFTTSNTPFHYYNSYDSNNFDIRSQLTSFVFGDSVEHIPAFLCCGMTDISSLVIPNKVRSIGNEAFKECGALTHIIVEVGNTNYDSRDNCNAIIETQSNTLILGCMNTIIPDNVSNIGDYAFYRCPGLSSITIGKNVTSFGKAAFSGCINLSSVVWNAEECPDFKDTDTPFYNGQVLGYSFDLRNQITSFVFGSNVKKIPAYLCLGMKQLTSIIIPSSVEIIGTSVFSGCTSLSFINIGDNVTSIGSRAFYGCSSLTTAPIPNSVTSIEELAFCGCSSLTSITIPNAMTRIEGSVFYGCSSLTAVTIPNSVTSIAGQAFLNCSGLKSVTIGKNVTYIGKNAFSGCSGVVSVNWYAKNCNGWNFGTQVESFIIGEEVEIIPTSLCAHMTKLTSINIPNSVTSIGDAAFSDCSGATSITIGSNVTSIGKSGLHKCKSLNAIICKALTPPTCGNYALDYIGKSIPVYVPASSIIAYQQADVWKDFTNIQAISEE